MAHNQDSYIIRLGLQTNTLTQSLQALHDQLLAAVPAIDHIACAFYDEKKDTLKTLLNSTRSGASLVEYSFKPSDIHTLNTLANSGDFGMLDNIAHELQSNSAHTVWLREQGYGSSFTVPIHGCDGFSGFVFFNALQNSAFTAPLQRDLVLYTNLISVAIAHELSAVRSILEAIRVARQLAGVKDFETGSHLDRMARYSRLIAQTISAAHDLGDEFVESIDLFASLHDIGKIGIPDQVLNKPGAFTPAERAVMETHVQTGMEIIDNIIGSTSTTRLQDFSMLRNIVSCHHEFLDGSGYPRKLKGDEIPLEARIVTVADIFDSLTADRPYKKVWTPEQAMLELDRMVAAGQLDEACVDAVHVHLPQFIDIRDHYED